MIIGEHNAQQLNVPRPSETTLSTACVLTKSGELIQSYGSYDVSTTLTLRHRHWRPCLELKMKLFTSWGGSSDEIELQNLHISEQKTVDENVDKEISIMFTKGSVITLHNQPKSYHNTESPSQPDCLDELTEHTKTMVSSMVTPMILEFAGGKNEMLTINLALNCPHWAEQVRNMVFSDGRVMVFADVGAKLEELKILKAYIERDENPLSKFYAPGSNTVNRYETSCFIANPVPSILLGFCASPVFKDAEEHRVAGLAKIELDREPEVRKIKAFENTPKTLILADFDGEEFSKEYEGLITKPGHNEYPLQSGETFEIQFGVGKWNLDKPAWRVTVMEKGSFKMKNMLPVFVRRGRYKNSDEYAVDKPRVVNATKLTESQLKVLISKDTGNTVTAKTVDCDSAYNNVRAAYIAGPCSSRVLEILLGLRIDLLEPIDLYQHIKHDVPDPQKYMMPLNPRQMDVLDAARHILGGLLIVQGPPGTGKTYTLLQLAMPFLAASKKTIILVAAPTNSGANDLAGGLCEMQAIAVAKFPEVKAKKPYVLRAYPEKTEDEITRTQGPKSDLKNSKIKKSADKILCSSGQGEEMRKLFEEVRTADEPKFDGVHDKRVAELGCSIGYMKLLIGGVFPGSVYAYPDKAKFETFRKLHAKQFKDCERLTVEEEKIWRRESDKLTALALQGALAIVSTTSTISKPALLSHIQEKVAAVFLDESAFEREDSLMPLFSARFSLGPCFVMIGDQEQLAPLTKAEEKENPFKTQLEMSFMARMINLGMSYIMLTEQHRMVDQIAEIANSLTYKGQLINDPCTQLNNRPLARKFRSYAEKNYGFLTNRLMIDLPPSKTNNVARNVKSSKSNEFSICIVAEIISSLLDEFGSEATIAVLTPYKGQKLKYRRLEGNMRKAKLKNFDKVTFDTLDGSQGRQFDVVVVDLVVGKSAGFLESEKRLNVAMTRAKNGLIVVCGLKMIDNAFYKQPIPTPYLKRLVRKFEGLISAREKDDKFPETKFYTPCETESTWKGGCDKYDLGYDSDDY